MIKSSHLFHWICWVWIDDTDQLKLQMFCRWWWVACAILVGVETCWVKWVKMGADSFHVFSRWILHLPFGQLQPAQLKVEEPRSWTRENKCLWMESTMILGTRTWKKVWEKYGSIVSHVLKTLILLQHVKILWTFDLHMQFYLCCATQ